MSTTNKLTDQEWADYLGCDVSEVPKIREIVNDMYYVAILSDPNVEPTEYCFALCKKSTAPSGFIRSYRAATGSRFFPTPKEAQEHAESEIIPLLRFPELKAKALEIPAKAMQMLEFSK